MGHRLLSRLAVAALVSTALVVAGTTTAQAAPPPTPTPVATTSLSGTALISVDSLNRQGYSLAEVQAAIANSPYVSLGDGPVVSVPGMMTPQGVTFGKFIYIRIDQRTAKALNDADTAAIVGLLGLATGGIGLVIAGTVFAYVHSLTDSYLSSCANWEIRETYPTPWSQSQIVWMGCYTP